MKLTEYHSCCPVAPMRFSYPNGSSPVDGYTIERGVGAGGFGEVYHAISAAGKHVALKRIQRNLDIELRGVRQCINLKHVNLISLWDIKTTPENETWVVMEYVPGSSLSDIVEVYPKGMPLDQVKRWFLSIASGVAYLHGKAIVHRDLKPGNVFLDEDSSVIKIGDYGLSKFMAPSRRSGQTESVGSFHYMAPEIGRGVYGKEIDIYAMGIILYEMLTGDVPFDGESTQEIVMKHLTDSPELSRIPETFRAAIETSLAKDPAQRFHDVPAMLAQMPWPEIAAESEHIVSHNSVGPLYSEDSEVRPSKSEKEISESDASSRYARDAERVNKKQLETNRLTTPTKSGARLPTPIIDSSDILVVPPEIVFGSLQDTSVPGQPTDAASKNDDSIRFIADSESTSPDGGVKPAPDEPIARVVQSSAQKLGDWWMNKNVSTGIKVFLLVVASLIILKNSEWLLPLAVVLSGVYLAYYGLRHWMLQSPSTEPDFLDAPESIQPAKPGKSKKLRKQQRIERIRALVATKPPVDRLTELVGSLLLGAFSCLTLNLLALAIGGSVLDATLESWAVYAWLVLTSSVAVWSLLVIGKFCEQHDGEAILRRLGMLGIGLGVGLIAFLSANAFNVDLADSRLFGFRADEPQQLSLEGVPLLPAYLIFFGLLFSLLRWWKQMDPARPTRLSILSVGLCLVWASLLSHLLTIPSSPNCILAVVISASIQLAAPWHKGV